MREDQPIQGEWSLHIGQWFLDRGAWTTSSSTRTWQPVRTATIGPTSEQLHPSGADSEWSPATCAFINPPGDSDAHWSVRTADIKFACGSRIFWVFDENYILSCRQGWDTSGNKHFTFIIQEYMKSWKSVNDTLWNTKPDLVLSGSSQYPCISLPGLP